MLPTCFNSLGSEEAPAITLKRMYHWVPRIISGLNQMFGFSRKATIPETTTGNSRFTGKAARNCATGCTAAASRGRMPTYTPIGTQIALASAINTTTRSSVTRPSSATCSTSCGGTRAST